MKRKKRNPLTGYLLIISMLIIIFLGLISNIRVQEEKQTIEIGTTIDYSSVKLTMFGSEVGWPVRVEGEIDTNTIGEYEIYYTPLFTFNKARVQVSVIDTKKPEIVLIGEKELTVKDISEYQELGCIATDNYDGDITGNVTTRVIKNRNNQYFVEYYVEDSSHNIEIVNRVINIIKGTVYLTFDDGPSYDITPEILDVLKENDIKATFFLVGYDKNKEDIVKRIYKEGHTIGLHGYSHKYSEIYTSIDVLMENFEKLEEMIKEVTGGYASKIIRFPGGASNTVSKKYCKGIMTEAVKTVQEYGYTFFDWNVDSGDAGSADTADEIYSNIISGIKPGRVNVVLMHDSSGHDETLEALKKVIEYCFENCYEFQAITSDTTPVQHNVSN